MKVLKSCNCHQLLRFVCSKTTSAFHSNYSSDPSIISSSFNSSSLAGKKVQKYPATQHSLTPSPNTKMANMFSILLFFNFALTYITSFLILSWTFWYSSFSHSCYFSSSCFTLPFPCRSFARASEPEQHPALSHNLKENNWRRPLFPVLLQLDSVLWLKLLDGRYLASYLSLITSHRLHSRIPLSKVFTSMTTIHPKASHYILCPGLPAASQKADAQYGNRQNMR